MSKPTDAEIQAQLRQLRRIREIAHGVSVRLRGARNLKLDDLREAVSELLRECARSPERRTHRKGPK